MAAASLGRVTEPLLVRAARREPVERTPVWFMRQAGRSLPEYRALRERHSFFDLAGTPELCAEVTLQPVARHDVDAAVLFADIMSPVHEMGIAVDLVEGLGPVVEHPIRSRADVHALHTSEPNQAILAAVRLVRTELPPEKALVGFCGAPFTVAGYLVEGGPSRDFARTKALMYTEPETWHALLELLTEQFAPYVRAQAEAGADVIQLFDSWVGALSAADLHREGYSAVGGAIDARGFADYAPGGGRHPGFRRPLVCPSLLPGLEPNTEVNGLPAYAPEADEPSMFDGRLVLRLRSRSGRRRR